MGGERTVTVRLQANPPPDEVREQMAAIPGVRFTAGSVTGQAGPEAALGPESAGALLVLHATFDAEQSVEPFWEANLPVLQRLADAPGFIRRISVVDGDSVYLIAFWRSEEDARQFAALVEHRAAVRALAGRIEYSHFVGLWSASSLHARRFFCVCGASTPAPSTTCRGCGEPLADVFATDATR
jgi:heme-degrading monooxygenase HmoA